jgi:ADP-heptose:LPS heptosyltransferase
MSHSVRAHTPLHLRRDAVRRIAVFRALFLGDLLCSVPALRALRWRYPEAEITLIGLPWAAEFVKHVPYIDRWVAFPGYQGIAELPYDSRRTQAFLRDVHATGFDIALQMHGNGQISNGFVAALDARLSLGYRCGADDRLSFSLLYERSQHEIVRWLRLVAALDAPVDDQRIEFVTTHADEREAVALLSGLSASDDSLRPLVALHAGAKDPARRWPPEQFAAIGDALVERFGARIVLTGSAGEREITSAVQRAMRYPSLDLAGATGLGPFAALLRRVNLLVTNDTGASHLAVAMATPSVVLFGPSRPEEWGPLDRERHRVIDALALSGADPALALRQLPLAPVLNTCIDMLKHKELQSKELGR